MQALLPPENGGRWAFPAPRASGAAPGRDWLGYFHPVYVNSHLRRNTRMEAVATPGEKPHSRALDSRASWKAAWLVLAILSVSYGSPLLIVVGMKTMQEALGTD